MNFVTQKWMKYEEKGEERSGDYGRTFRRGSSLFSCNPEDEAIFAGRVVKALARRPCYGLWTFPSGKKPVKTALAKRIT